VADGWTNPLLNLRAERRLRARFPGLARVYDRLREGWASSPGGRQGRAATLGDAFLGRLLVGRTEPGLSARERRRLHAAWRSWERQGERWLAGRSSRVPVPELPPPRRALPYQARVMPAPGAAAAADGPAGSSGAAGGYGLVLGSTAGGTRIVLPLAPASAVAGDERPPEGMPPAESASTDVGWRDAGGRETCWYPEWDAERGGYRPDWCAVREEPVGVGPSADVEGSPAPASVRRVRRAFERHIATARWTRREVEGAELDLEALADAWAEDPRLPDERLFRSKRLRHPGAAVAVLADLSDSVSGWTLDVEKRALLLLAAALEAVGDAFALYGFCGRSRLGCKVLRIKDFTEPHGAPVTGRVLAARPAGYTRIAASLRHVTERLAAVDVRHRILLLITDGMPFDVGGYGGAYAVEDTRMAWIEARRRGIRPYCLTIDFTANQYLPRMCGPASWTLVDERERLPDALLRLYRRVRT
jgi:hypothetical protein